MFVSVKFREGDARTYTYLANEDYAVGDRVLVEVKGEAKIVHVAELDLPAPQFTCKAIIGMAPPKDEPAPGDDPFAAEGGAA